MANNDEISSKNLKVLVVEDDVVGRMLLNEILKDFCTSVTFARNGKEGVEMVAADPTFSFILMDLKMPVMNGYVATKEIRKLGYSKPIIAQTAYATEEDIEKIEEANFDGYLAKPIKKNTLLDVLKKHL
ncbi:MAG: response regulator [Bacteroidales bacterium]